MKIIVDKERCIMCHACVSGLSGCMGLEDDGQYPKMADEAVCAKFSEDEIVDVCPVGALSVEA